MAEVNASIKCADPTKSYNGPIGTATSTDQENATLILSRAETTCGAGNAATATYEVGGAAKAYDDLKRVADGTATPPPPAAPTLTPRKAGDMRGIFEAGIGGSGGDFPGFGRFRLASGLSLNVAPSIRLDFLGVLGLPFAFQSVGDVDLSKSEVLARGYPNVRNDDGVTDITGGKDSTKHSPFGVDLGFELAPIFELSRYFHLGPYLGLSWMYKGGERTTTVHGTTGDKYHSEHYTADGGIPGDSFGAGAPIPSPDVATPGTRNDIGPFTKDVGGWLMAVRAGAKAILPFDANGDHNLVAQGGYVNLGGQHGGEGLLNYMLRFGGPTEEERTVTPPPPTPTYEPVDPAVDATGTYDGDLRP